MKNSSDINVDIVVETNEKDRSEKISTSLTPDASTLAFQIRKIAQSVELASRAVLHRKYADELIKAANTSTPPDIATTIQVSVMFNNTPVTTFEGEKVILSEKAINQTKPFAFKTINSVKEKLAMTALSFFDKTAKEPVVFNGVVIPFN